MSFFIPFFLKDKWFGVEAVHVKEVSRCLPITKVPNMPSFVEGVVNLRGKVIPTIDLRKRLNIEQGSVKPTDRLLVVHSDTRFIGYWVTETLNAISLAPNVITAPPVSDLESGYGEYLLGAASLEEYPLLIIDVTKLLSLHEKQTLGVMS